ncbi:hypothetical protein C8J56DRAFT_784937, partial [Mycena floridula]
ERPVTENNLSLVKKYVKNHNGKTPTSKSIWMAICVETFTRRIQNYIYLALHSAQRNGLYWKHIPECADRQFYKHCPNIIESMTHILTECSQPIQHQIWGLAKRIFELKSGTWPVLKLGMILGCSLLTFVNVKGKPHPGLQRLFCILVPASAHLIWKIRCEILLDENKRNPNPSQVHNRWISAVNKRLEADCFLTSRFHYRSRALPHQVVFNTWSRALMNETSLPDNWIWSSQGFSGYQTTASSAKSQEPKTCDIDRQQKG